MDIALGTNFLGNPIDNVIGITGTSYAGPATRYDIVTVLMEAGTGNLFTGWSNVGLGVGARSFDGTAHSNDRPVGLDLHWSTIPSASGGALFVVVAGTTRSVNNSQINDDIWTIEYDPDGAVRWEQVYNGPANGDDVATAMTLDFGGIFVCGYTLHDAAGPSASPGRGGAPSAAAVPDTDYIALAYEDSSGFPWPDWPDVGSPNVEGVRVWNGPGPAGNKSDDRAMDIVVDGFGDMVWVTGYVREADGVGYDAATISYFATLGLQPANPIDTLTPPLPTTTEKGVGLDANDLDVYVTASIQTGQSMTWILTFKIKEGSGTYTLDWMGLFGSGISDIPSAIIAPTAEDLSVPVFVAGRSYLLTTSHDQISFRYNQ